MKTTTTTTLFSLTLIALLGLLSAVPASAALFGSTTVDGSLCVGNDCNTDPPSPAYGVDTIRLMENNLRILAMDTSGGAFPRRDWQIEFNSSTSGGATYFMVRDCGNDASTSTSCGGTAQFTIRGGADNDSIYVSNGGNQGGNVGFGTNNPVVDLHALSGNTPTLRLDQDNSSGFGPQVWDIAGNEANFFIRDVTNGSTLPIRIEPGTGSNTLYLDSAERIGIGTSNPEQVLHVRRSDGSTQVFIEEASGTTAQRVLLRLRNNGQARMVFNDTATGANWFNGAAGSGDFVMDDTIVGGTAFRMTQSGNLTLNGTLITGGGGACDPGPCDGVFAPEFEVESIEDHAEYMWSNRHLRGVGPTPEGAPIEIPKKTTGILNELEKAHIYIEQLHRRLEAKSDELTSVSERLEQIEALLLEGGLTR